MIFCGTLRFRGTLFEKHCICLTYPRWRGPLVSSFVSPATNNITTRVLSLVLIKECTSLRAVLDCNGDFIRATTSTTNVTAHVTALCGGFALSSQQQMGERKDKNCSSCARHSVRLLFFAPFNKTNCKFLHVRKCISIFHSIQPARMDRRLWQLTWLTAECGPW